MKVNVLFFGAVADVVGTRSLDILVPAGTAADTVFDELLARFPALNGHKLLFSVNQEYAAGGQAVNDGDELAVFTAVSGG